LHRSKICALRWDCLEYDKDRSPVLVYDNHKNARLGRRLPITHATAELVTGQKDRVRARFPDTPLAQLKAATAPWWPPAGWLSQGLPRRSVSRAAV